MTKKQKTGVASEQQPIEIVPSDYVDIVQSNELWSEFTLKDGTVLSGSVENETTTTLTLRTLTGPVSVPLGEVKERQKLEQSLMPPGLLETLPEREMLELLKFLTTNSR